jgi:hypothetical protein
MRYQQTAAMWGKRFEKLALQHLYMEGGPSSGVALPMGMIAPAARPF